MSRQKQVGILFWGATVFWIALYLIISPEFGGIDSYIFKDAGANWAMGRGFVTSLLPGNRDIDPHLFASYTPAYPLLFGIYSKIFGLGPYQNTFFNLALAWLCILIWYQLIMRMLRGMPGSRIRWLFVGALALLIPTAALGVARERPESLSCALLLWGVWLSTTTVMTKWRWLAIFGLVGLNATVSPFCAIIHLLCMILIHRKTLFKLQKPIPMALTAFVATATTPLIMIAIYAFTDPSAFGRFLEHSSKNGSGLGVVIDIFRTGGITLYLQTIYQALSGRMIQQIGTNVSSLLICSIISGYFLVSFIRKKNTEYLLYSIAVLVISLLGLFLFPNQGNYLAFSRNAVVAVIIHYAITNERLTRNLATVLGASMLAITLSQIVLLSRDLAIRSTNSASYDRAIKQADELSSRVGKINRVAVWPSLYFIYKPRVNLVDIYWLPQKYHHLPKVFVLAYAESGDLFQTVKPGGIRLPASEVISKPNLPQPTELFGVKISKSSNTWESLIYENPDYRP